jgi:hypothetical protein
MENMINKKVETVFDYNPTEDELKRFGLSPRLPDYEQRFAGKQQLMAGADASDYFIIGQLFYYRGDHERARKYFEKDPEWSLYGPTSFLGF